MLGTGYPIESFRPINSAASESAQKLSLHEFGNADSAWLMAEMHQNGPAGKKHSFRGWLGSIRAAASKVAAMLF